MTSQSVDEILDGGTGALEYFRLGLDLVRQHVGGDWPDWQHHVCNRYDRERFTDLAAITRLAERLQAAADASEAAIDEQGLARERVRGAWPDSAGQAALESLDAHQQRSDPVATALADTAAVVAAVPAAVTAAVEQKVADLSEFAEAELPRDSWWTGWSYKDESNESNESNVWLHFANQFRIDLDRFDEVIDTASAAVVAAYATVPATTAAVDTSPFPTPNIAPIGGSAPAPGGTSPGTAPGGGTTAPGGGGTAPGGGSTGGGASTGGGGAPGGGGMPGGGAPAAMPSGTGTGATGLGEAPPAGVTPPGGAAPASTLPQSLAGAAEPAAAAAGEAAGAMPSWLSDMLPKIADQLGLGKDKDELTDEDDDEQDPDGKPGGGEGEVDENGRSVTATLGPDGKTVDVTVTEADGTERRATLLLGENGTLTMAPAPGAPPGAGAPGASPGPGAPGTPPGNGGAMPTENPPPPGAPTPEEAGTESAAGPPSGTEPLTTPPPEGSAPPGAAPPGAVPSLSVPPPTSPPPTSAPPMAAPPPSGAGSGAEFAVTES